MKTRPARASKNDAPIGVDLYWLPLGAGGNFVRFNGKVYEAILARQQHRPPRDLYHCALQVFMPEGRYVIEMTPEGPPGEDRGVVGRGPVGARWGGRFRPLRYELRRWLGGEIPDIAEAVDSPRHLSDRMEHGRRVLEAAPEVPMLVWGRDELGVGDMWNSNSQIAWILATAGFPAEAIEAPPGGRAPGWRAGIYAANAGVRGMARGGHWLFRKEAV